MINLAEIERELRKDEDARKLLNQALEIEERVLGPDQPETSVTKYDLATIFARNGQAYV